MPFVITTKYTTEDGEQVTRYYAPRDGFIAWGGREQAEEYPTEKAAQRLRRKMYIKGLRVVQA